MASITVTANATTSIALSGTSAMGAPASITATATPVGGGVAIPLGSLTGVVDGLWAMPPVSVPFGQYNIEVDASASILVNATATVQV